MTNSRKLPDLSINVVEPDLLSEECSILSCREQTPTSDQPIQNIKDVAPPINNIKDVAAPINNIKDVAPPKREMRSFLFPTSGDLSDANRRVKLQIERNNGMHIVRGSESYVPFLECHNKTPQAATTEKAKFPKFIMAACLHYKITGNFPDPGQSLAVAVDCNERQTRYAYSVDSKQHYSELMALLKKERCSIAGMTSTNSPTSSPPSFVLQFAGPIKHVIFCDCTPELNTLFKQIYGEVCKLEEEREPKEQQVQSRR